MSVIAGSPAQRPALVSGVAGGVAGLVLGIGITIIGFSFGDRGVTVREAEAIERSPAWVFDALAQHSSREYGPFASGASLATTAAMQRHLTLEYREPRGAAGATHAARLFEHTLREEAAP